jgi:hypothetical protein
MTSETSMGVSRASDLGMAAAVAWLLAPTTGWSIGFALMRRIGELGIVVQHFNVPHSSRQYPMSAP